MMNKFGRFLGRISAETCLKTDYFRSKSPKIAKRWMLRSQTSLPPVVGGRGGASAKWVGRTKRKN